MPSMQAKLPSSRRGTLLASSARQVRGACSRRRGQQRATATGTPIVSKYRDNGLGFRIGWQYHQPSGGGGPGIVAADPWYWLVYNDRWQQIAAYRIPGGTGAAWTDAAEAQPKEIITHHMAGVNGSGGSSYIDSVVMRERDDQPWGSAADTGSGWELSGRQYLLQNWRADVVLAVDSGGAITDRIRYSAYGEPQRYSLCDLVGGGASGTAPDAIIDASDYIAFMNAYGADDPLADVNGDGVVDGSDFMIFLNVYSVGSDGPLGTGTLSADLDTGFRRGYAGYEFDPVLGANLASVYHVRNRVYDAENGRWNKRDPLGYVAGMGLYEYCRSMPVNLLDTYGLDVGWAKRKCNYPSPYDPVPTPRLRICFYDGTDDFMCPWLMSCKGPWDYACPVYKWTDIMPRLKEYLRTNPDCYIGEIEIICHGEPGYAWIGPGMNQPAFEPVMPWFREACNLIKPSDGMFRIDACNVGGGKEGFDLYEACVANGGEGCDIFLQPSRIVWTPFGPWYLPYQWYKLNRRK